MVSKLLLLMDKGRSHTLADKEFVFRAHQRAAEAGGAPQILQQRHFVPKRNFRLSEVGNVGRG